MIEDVITVFLIGLSYGVIAISAFAVLVVTVHAIRSIFFMKPKKASARRGR